MARRKRKKNQEELPEVPSNWKPYATFGDFPTYGGIVYAKGSGNYGMLLGQEGESRDDVWVWVVDDMDKEALQDYDLDEVAEHAGFPELRQVARSDDPRVLGDVWQAVADYHGYLDTFGDPDWSGSHDDIWNEFADDYNAANRARNPGPNPTEPARPKMASALIRSLKF